MIGVDLNLKYFAKKLSQVKFDLRIVTLLFFITIFTASCLKAKQAALKKVVNTAKLAKDADAAALAAMAAKKDAKLQEGKIDTTINSKIESKLKSYALKLDSLGVAIAFLERASNFKPLFLDSKPIIEKQLSFIKSYNESAGARLRRFKMIDEGLNWAKLHVFNLAAFFGPGKYQIPEDKMPLADKSFSPILDSLVTFYNEYKDVERKATLIILGYADGTGFNPASPTYKEISTLLNDSAPAKEILNKKLSELRSDNFGDVMELLLSRKLDAYDSLKPVDFVFVETGKGEEFPSKKIKDYKVNDERRRVVLFFWNILPK